MRLNEMTPSLERIEDIQHKLGTLKFDQIDFAKSFAGSFKTVSKFLSDMKIEMLEINELVSLYHRLAQYEGRKVTPGSGPIDKALDHAVQVLTVAIKDVHHIPESASLMDDYRLVIKQAETASGVLKKIVSEIDEVLNYKPEGGTVVGNRGSIEDMQKALADETSHKKPRQTFGKYTEHFSAIKDALRLVSETLDAMVAKIHTEVLKTS